MQSRKVLVVVFALLLVGFVVPTSIPKGHADDTSESLNTSGYAVRATYDSFLGRTVDAVQGGNTLTFTLVFVANNANFQRNVSMGVKFDWMNNFQNTSGTTSVLANQVAYVTLTFTIPTLTGQYSGLNLTPHSWTLQVWDMALGSVWTNFCFDTGTTSCRSFFNNYPLAIYSSAQATSILTRQQASAEITALQNSLRSVLQAPPGTSAAVAFLAQASEQLSLGDTAYQTGDFSTAQTDYQNSLNSANAAQSSLATTGGGTDTATLTRIWIEGVAALLGGIGAILVGIAGFNYLRHRSKAPSGYTPASPAK